MAKYRPAKAGKAKPTTKTSVLRAIPCLLLVLIGIALMTMLFYSMMTSSRP